MTDESLETAAKAAVVAGSGTSEKGTSERLKDAKDKIAAQLPNDEGDLSQAETLERAARDRNHDEETSTGGFRKPAETQTR